MVNSTPSILQIHGKFYYSHFLIKQNSNPSIFLKQEVVVNSTPSLIQTVVMNSTPSNFLKKIVEFSFFSPYYAFFYFFSGMSYYLTTVLAVVLFAKVRGLVMFESPGTRILNNSEVVQYMDFSKTFQKYSNFRAMSKLDKELS